MLAQPFSKVKLQKTAGEIDSPHGSSSSKKPEFPYTIKYSHFRIYLRSEIPLQLKIRGFFLEKAAFKLELGTFVPLVK
jgi:hypothetical protein